MAITAKEYRCKSTREKDVERSKVAESYDNSMLNFDKPPFHFLKQL